MFHKMVSFFSYLQINFKNHVFLQNSEPVSYTHLVTVSTAEHESLNFSGWLVATTLQNQYAFQMKSLGIKFHVVRK